jgi:hypothetical protein
MITPESGREPSEMVEHCKRCGRLLDVPGNVASENCGGDCCACMADAGDPDCIAALGAGQME